MDAELKTKSDWKRAVADAEADGKHAESMLNKYPKSAKYLSRVEEAKTEAEDARERLRELKDPADQLRHKSERYRKLADKEKKLRESLRDKAVAIAEAQDEVDAMREQIHELCDEMERIKSEQTVLVLQGTPAAPVDLGQSVEAMREDFATLFDDSTLPSCG